MKNLNSEIEKLKSILENLPALTEKLHTWNKIIKELDFKERDYLELCIKDLESEEIDLDLLKLNCETIEIQVDLYKTLFNSLIERISFPISFYKEKIEQLEYFEFKVLIASFRKQTNLDFISSAKEKAKSYYEQYTEGVKSGKIQIGKHDFINQAKSMITPFLFQPPLFNCKNQKERELMNKEFSGWNPNEYVLIFCNEINELFKNV